MEKIKEHFANSLEVEPEVQAELSMYQTVRENRQSLMEFTGQLQRKLTEFDNAIGEKIPPNMKGFIIKRQSRLTSDHEKLFHLHNMSR